MARATVDAPARDQLNATHEFRAIEPLPTVALRPADDLRRARWSPGVPALLLRVGFRVVFVLDVLSAVAALALTGNLGWRQAIAVAVTVVLYAMAGLYKGRLSLSILDHLPALVSRALVATALVALVTRNTNPNVHQGSLLSAALATLSAICVTRALFYVMIRGARRRGQVEHRTLILGAGRMGRRLADLLIEHPEYGLRPVGFCDTARLMLREARALPTLGTPEQLASLLLDHDIKVIIEAFPSMPEKTTVQILNTCDRLKCEIFVVPRLFELYGTGAGVDQVWGMPLVRLRRPTHRTVWWRLKRVVDIVVSVVGLVVLAPVFVACAIAVRLEGGPGVLFRQRRVGLDRRPFDLLKFRSLRPANQQESETRWSIAEDARMGPVGAFLRKTSLDELPQLINILRGDMTLVGPRPERPHFVEEFSRMFPRYEARHRVPAGLTGLAQVHGLRGDTSIEERAYFDNTYIENWSLWADIKILLRTAGAVLRGAGR